MLMASTMNRIRRQEMYEVSNISEIRSMSGSGCIWNIVGISWQCVTIPTIQKKMCCSLPSRVFQKFFTMTFPSYSFRTSWSSWVWSLLMLSYKTTVCCRRVVNKTSVRLADVSFGIRKLFCIQGCWFQINRIYKHIESIFEWFTAIFIEI